MHSPVSHQWFFLCDFFRIQLLDVGTNFVQKIIHVNDFYVTTALYFMLAYIE